MTGKPTLVVVTVKKFVYYNNRYWTYGGFGDYIQAILPYFDKIIIACHPKKAERVPAGWYLLENAKLEFFRLPYYEKEHECLMKLPAMFWQCRKAVRQGDIINPRVPDYSGICGGFWAVIQKKPRFISLVDNWHPRVFNLTTRLKGVARFGLRIHLALYCILEKILCRKGLVFAQGESLMQVYSGNPLAKKCISTSHYDNQISCFRDTCLDHGRVKLLAVGRLISVKGHQDLLKVLALLNREETGLTFSLTITGEGENRRSLERSASELGLGDSVFFTGQAGREEIFRLYDDADIFCLSSYSEGTPKVVLEAMARSLPVIATDVGGVSSVVKHRHTGLLVSAGAVEETAGAIRQMVSSKDLRHHCIKNGLEVARAYTVEKEWTKMIATVKSYYPDLWTAQG